MQLTKREKQIKYVVYCLLLCLCSILQNVDGLLFEIGGARCFLLIPVAVMLTIDEDEKVAALMGLFAGFLWDMTSVHHRGFNGIFFMIACYICASLVTHIFRDTFMFTMVCSTVTIFLYCLLYWLLFIVGHKVDGGGWSFLYFYLPSAVYTSLSALILSLIIKPIKKKLNKTYEIE